MEVLSVFYLSHSHPFLFPIWTLLLQGKFIIIDELIIPVFFLSLLWHILSKEQLSYALEKLLGKTLTRVNKKKKSLLKINEKRALYECRPSLAE